LLDDDEESEEEEEEGKNDDGDDDDEILSSIDGDIEDGIEDLEVEEESNEPD